MEDDFYVILPRIVDGTRITRKFIRSITGNSVRILDGRKDVPPEFIATLFFPLRGLRHDYMDMVLIGPMTADDLAMCKLSLSPSSFRLVIGPVKPEALSNAISLATSLQLANREANDRWEEISSAANRNRNDVASLHSLHSTDPAVVAKVQECVELIDKSFQSEKLRFRSEIKRISIEMQPVIEGMAAAMRSIAVHDKAIAEIKDMRTAISRAFLPNIASIRARRLRLS